jgi:hypothetical protein
MHSLVLEKTCSASQAKCKDLFWNIDKWAEFWAPIQNVKTTYSSSLQQEFVMNLDWEGRETQIRTFRFLKPDSSIEFFSADTPEPICQHWGEWQFVPINSNSSILMAKRWYTLSKGAPEEFHARFKQRITNLLEAVSKWCEVN